MKAAVVGYGFVGKALGEALEVPFLVLDPKFEKSVQGLDDILEFQPYVIFLCLPTPTVDGKCDDTLIMKYVQDLKDYQGVLCIKSTIPVGTVEKIEAILPNAVLWPELLVEKTAVFDMVHPSITVIGTRDRAQYDWMYWFLIENTKINTDLGKSIHRCTMKEASVFKYTVNSFLAMKVVFMHEMYNWLRARGEESSYKILTDMLSVEGRVGASHMKAPGDHGLGFAGSCFPKDTQALRHQASLDGVHLELLNAGIQANENLRAL
jgi:UDPglucose 6-dehydrogenase